MPVVFIHGAGVVPDPTRPQDYPVLARLMALCPDLIVPVMPGALDPTPESWMRGVEAALSPLGADAVWIGHSLGASMILKWVAERRPRAIARSYLGLATPYWEEFGFGLPDDYPTALAGIARMTFCQAKDDEYFGTAHLDRYAGALPGARRMLLESGGHALDTDSLIPVLRDALSA